MLAVLLKKQTITQKLLILNLNIKLSNLNIKITKNKTDHLLVQNEFKKLQTFDSRYFIGKNYFEEDGTQNYLVFQPIRRHFRLIADSKLISSWKSKGLSNETIQPYTTSDNSLTPLINYYGSKVRVKFNKSRLKQSNNSKHLHCL